MAPIFVCGGIALGLVAHQDGADLDVGRAGGFGGLAALSSAAGSGAAGAAGCQRERHDCGQQSAQYLFHVCSSYFIQNGKAPCSPGAAFAEQLRKPPLPKFLRAGSFFGPWSVFPSADLRSGVLHRTTAQARHMSYFRENSARFQPVSTDLLNLCEPCGKPPFSVRKGW